MTAACMGLNRKNCERGLPLLGGEGRSCCSQMVKFGVSSLGHSTFCQENSAPIILAVSAVSSFHYSACCLCFKTFCLGCCPSSLVESKQILTRVLLASGDVDAAQPTSITLETAVLVAVPPSPPGAGEVRKQLQALGESVCRGCLLFEACLWFPCLKCSVLTQLPAAYCPGSWDTGSANTWLNKAINYVTIFPAQIILVSVTYFPHLIFRMVFSVL